MAFGGALRDEEAGCDLAIRQPLSDEVCNLSLPPSELRRFHQTGEEHSNSALTWAKNRYRIPVPAPVLLLMTGSASGHRLESAISARPVQGSEAPMNQ